MKVEKLYYTCAFPESVISLSWCEINQLLILNWLIKLLYEMLFTYAL